MAAFELEGKVAVVAGATRGAGRGIACALGEAGATVYCTGRSIRRYPSPIGRPETIEETAEMVTSLGGEGLWAQVDHTQPDQVKALFERVNQEQGGRLDVLVNDLTGDAHIDWEPPFWEHSLQEGLLALQSGITAHIITSHYGAQMMVKRKQGLIVEVNDGNGLGYRGSFYYSLNKDVAILMAHYLSAELRKHEIAAVCITPGYLRSEVMLERLGVTEEKWRDGIEEDPIWADSETPYYIGRAVAALAADPKVMRRTGRALSSGWLARDYGFTDVDGRQPPGYYPKEGVFTRRRGFELQAADLSAVERLFRFELLAVARELGIAEVSRKGNTELIAVIERIDPERLKRVKQDGQ
jgi:NAD(P)-dependent dehydrogenase (short-subunit alcohol dehydrogenase family)